MIRAMISEFFNIFNRGKILIFLSLTLTIILLSCSDNNIKPVKNEEGCNLLSDSIPVMNTVTEIKLGWKNLTVFCDNIPGFENLVVLDLQNNSIKTVKTINFKK